MTPADRRGPKSRIAGCASPPLACMSQQCPGCRLIPALEVPKLRPQFTRFTSASALMALLGGAVLLIPVFRVSAESPTVQPIISPLTAWVDTGTYPSGIERLGRMAPGASIEVSTLQFTRDDGLSTNLRDGVEPNTRRRVVRISVDENCAPTVTNELYDAQTGARIYVIRTRDGVETITFDADQESSGTASEPRSETLTLSQPGAIRIGQLCSESSAPRVNWADVLNQRSNRGALPSAYRGMPVQVYVLTQDIDANTREKFWMAVPGLRDISSEITQIIQQVIYSPDLDIVVSTTSSAVTDSGNHVIFDAFEVEWSKCNPTCAR